MTDNLVRLARMRRLAAAACMLVLAAPAWGEDAARSDTVAAVDSRPFQFESADGRYGLRLGARLEYDISDYRDDDGINMGSGANVRRARLVAHATLPHDWVAKLSYDFSRDGTGRFRDVYLRYEGLDSTRITGGHFKEPFGMERLTSVRDLAFLERSLVSLLTPPRVNGVEVHRRGDTWTAAAGAFGKGFASGGTNVGRGLSGRATFAPMQDAGRILHFGAGIAHRWTGSNDEVRFRQRPESRTTDVRLVDTRTVRADAFTYYGAELAGAHGPLSFQAEYILAQVDRGAYGDDLRFYGWYVQGGWFITGEPQVYNSEKATFGRMRPARTVGRGGYGAWQIGARFSRLDLTDRDIDGGRESNQTYALSWYITPTLRLITEYIRTDIDGGRFDGAQPRILQGRIQLAY